MDGTQPAFETQLSHAIHSIERQDVNALLLILSENQVYLNGDRETFGTLIAKCFLKFINSNDTELRHAEGRCNFTKNSGNCYTFIGNHSRNFIEIIIDSSDGQITGISECYCHSASDPNPYGGVRIYIDPYQGSPF